jgi:hypothetical protein
LSHRAHQFGWMRYGTTPPDVPFLDVFLGALNEQALNLFVGASANFGSTSENIRILSYVGLEAQVAQ